ncbi:hypothetical protein CDL15_Pgr016490 [Punica granatum]|uniref:Uncharacterized protein n=1 Tax=Punica granatum TaxID=22663 RepID=A0A218WW05_PUNGR|nr:hypothetical protein CDL15_Pgr016490 [Punica granatum]
MDAESWMRVRKAVKMDAESWTRSLKSCKDGRGVRKAVKMDVESWTRRDAIARECCHSEAVLWFELTLGTKTHLASVESEDCTWLSRKDGHHFPLVV